MAKPDPIGELFVEHFNLDLAELDSVAHFALPRDLPLKGQLELQGDEGNFLVLIPSDASPAMVATAYRL